MTGVVACIPTIGLSPHLDDLVHTLAIENSIPTRLYVNSEHVTESLLYIVEGWPHLGLIELIHEPDDTIYVEWNKAAIWARERHSYLLCVTDDVVLLPETAPELVAALDVRPDYGLISTDIGVPHPSHAPSDVHAVSHQAGSRYAFATWCFVARVEAWQDVDPRYRIWYGDDDLIWKVNAAGWKTGYLRGEGVTHHTSTTSNQLPWIHAAAAEDGQLWASLH